MKVNKKELKEIARLEFHQRHYETMIDLLIDALDVYLERNKKIIVSASRYAELAINRSELNKAPDVSREAKTDAEQSD